MTAGSAGCEGATGTRATIVNRALDPLPYRSPQCDAARRVTGGAQHEYAMIVDGAGQVGGDAAAGHDRKLRATEGDAKHRTTGTTQGAGREPSTHGNIRRKIVIVHPFVTKSVY